MKQLVLRAAVALALTSFLQPVVAADHSAHAAPAEKGAVQPMAEGTIKKLDMASGKITIAHGEIANLNMPPMTMSFKAKDAAMLKPWKAGDKIRFRAVDVKGVLTVDSIEAAK